MNWRSKPTTNLIFQGQARGEIPMKKALHDRITLVSMKIAGQGGEIAGRGEGRVGRESHHLT
jgi:hypothetical protein